ncbi:MAG: hypothetical protein WAO20_13170 [Acidobacteriota bacterium]
MKRKLNDLKLPAILILLALTNFAVDGYPTLIPPECEDCEEDEDSWNRYCELSLRFEPSWISVYGGESMTVNATCGDDQARWSARAGLSEGLFTSVSATPGPGASSTVTVRAVATIPPGTDPWGGQGRYCEGTVWVSADVSGNGSSTSFCSSRHGGERFKVLGLIDQIDTLANIGADPGGTGWLDLQVTKRRYSSSPGDWTFSAALENPADAQFVTGLSATSTGPGTARLNYTAAENIAPPAWCDAGRPYCNVSIPVLVTAAKAGGTSVTETTSISVLVKMPG